MPYESRQTFGLPMVGHGEKNGLTVMRYHHDAMTPHHGAKHANHP